jgi:hypothetical protein
MMPGVTEIGEIDRKTFAWSDVKSLAWIGDDLVDVAAGGRRLEPDGTVTNPHVVYAFPFDRAVGSPSGMYSVLYTTLGTKGLVLKQGRLVREINRSYYCANSYEYPIALGRLDDGREVIAYCPEEYNRIEIEELESGRRLTTRDSESPDFFHSRLQISPDGRYLLSAGWVWHPWSSLMVFDLREAIREPRSLDGRGLLAGHEIANAEVEAAVFLNSDHMLVSTSFDDEVLDDERDGTSLDPREAGAWSLRENKSVTRATLGERTGTLMSLGGPFLGFYEHPRLFDPATGRVTHRWDDLFTGRQTSSILIAEGGQMPPPLALDPVGRRFAVANQDTVTVVSLGPLDAPS